MKSKIIAVLLLVCVLLTGCSSTYANIEDENEQSDIKISMFVLVEETGTWRVVYHRETKVMYAVSAYSSNYGNFTLLVNADGSPMLWED